MFLAYATDLNRRTRKHHDDRGRTVQFCSCPFLGDEPHRQCGYLRWVNGGRDEAQTKRTAWTCAVAVAIILLVVTWTGSLLLDFFGITVDALRAAGGVIVFLIGLNMLNNNKSHQHTPAEHEDAKSRPSVAVVPLAIPIVAGPGTMATVLVVAHQSPALASRFEITAIVLTLSALIGFLFSFAEPISKRLGESGMGVVTRVMGMILATIAIGMLADGLKGLMPGLAG